MRSALAATVLLLACTLPARAAAPTADTWKSLAPGLDLGTFKTTAGDATINVLRIDPAKWTLDCLDVTRTDDNAGLTARQWCAAHGFTAAINFGMYAADNRSHVGYLEWRGVVAGQRTNGYQSVAATHPRPGSGQPPFRIIDLDDPKTTITDVLKDYESVVQNLRLIKRPGENRWKQQPKRWSEAALAEDDQGRILFVFLRSPLTMYDFNNELLALGIGVVAAQHLEGGPIAQLYVKAGGQELELVGGFETGVAEGIGNGTAWPIPGVLGIRPR